VLRKKIAFSMFSFNFNQFFRTNNEGNVCQPVEEKLHIKVEAKNAQEIMHLYMLSFWGGRPGIGGGFGLRSVFLLKCPAPGKSSWVKKVQIPHTRVIIVGQKNSTNDQKSLPRAHL